MSELVANCPRCRTAKITFDVVAFHVTGMQYSWKAYYEAFAICRHCNRATTFELSDSLHSDYDTTHKKGLLKLEGSLNNSVDIDGFVNIANIASEKPPEHLPKEIDAAFREGAKCHAIACYNAAATMFRLCIDHGTRSLLPADNVDGLDSRIRWSLGLRLKWLLDTGRLPEALRDLSTAVKEDGNDGAHIGILKPEDAGDLLDFTVLLLERMYTEPKRLALAAERRASRRK